MLIAFSGERRAGKDTASKYLERYEFRHLKFAYPIRLALDLRFDLPFHWDWDQDKTIPQRLLDGMTKREALQKYGTEGFDGSIAWIDDGYTVIEIANYLSRLYKRPIKNLERFLECCDRGGFRDKIDDNFWAECLNPSSTGNTSVSDLRFPNEWTVLKNRGGFHIHIIGEKQEETTNHQSEAHQEWLKRHADFIIDNRARSDKFYKELDRVVDEITRIMDSWQQRPLHEQ